MAKAAKRTEQLTLKEQRGEFTSERVYELFGPLVEITRKQESRMLKDGKWRNVLCIMSAGELMYADVGHHIVNVDVIMKTKKQMPENLKVNDWWFIR